MSYCTRLLHNAFCSFPSKIQNKTTISTALTRHISSTSSSSGGGRRHYNFNSWILVEAGGLLTGILVIAGTLPPVLYQYWDLYKAPFTMKIDYSALRADLDEPGADQDFEQWKEAFRKKILPATHPDSVRALLLTKTVTEGFQRAFRLENVSNNVRYGVVSESSSFQEKERNAQDLNWEVVVVDLPLSDVWYFPGGKFFVFGKLLKKCTTDEELATFIANEMGFMLAAEEMRPEFMKNLKLTLASCVLGVAATKRLGRVQLASVFLFGIYTAYRYVFGADHITLQLMAWAGYNPRVVPKVYEKMKEGQKERVQWLNHPPLMEEALAVYWKVGLDSEGKASVTNIILD